MKASTKVMEYIEAKQMIKVGQAIKKDRLPDFIEDVATKVMELRGKGLKTKSAYNKALKEVKAEVTKDKEVNVNYEFGLVSYFLNLGLSLDKIANNVTKLHKWRMDKLSIKQILKTLA